MAVDTGRKLNVYKTFRRRPGRLLNVLCTFKLSPVSTGVALFSDQNFQKSTSGHSDECLWKDYLGAVLSEGAGWKFLPGAFLKL